MSELMKTRGIKHAIQDKLVTWRESAKEEIEKHSEAGVMIKASRYKANMTQKELADILDIKQHHVSEMENGKRSIGKEMAHRLASVFDVNYRIFL